jgi:hypothetical protein
VQPFTETPAARQDKLIGETNTPRKTRHRVLYKPLQLRNGIRAVSDHAACANALFPAKSLQLIQGSLKSRALAQEDVPRAERIGLHFNNPDEDDAAEPVRKEALHPQKGMNRRTPMFGHEQDRHLMIR